MNDTRPAITADRVRLSASARQVYPPLTFEVLPGSLAALLGASGTGKTALLLTIAGRMRGWHGRVDVCGLDAARHSARVRALVGLSVMAGVNDLSESLTAQQHVAEQRAFVPSTKQSRNRDVLARVRLDSAADIPVRALDAEQRMRLGIALALVRDVQVLVVDDLDRDLDHEERARVLALLRELADDGLTIVFACVDENTATAADAIVAMDGTSARLTEVPTYAVA